MKKATISMVMVLMAVSTFAQFRGTTWGMSLEQVIAIEGRGEISRNERFTTMQFEGVRLLDFTGTLRFSFLDSKLYHGEYRLPGHSLVRVREALNHRFGRPHFALGSGTTWRDGATDIRLEYFDVTNTVFVFYADREVLAALRRAQREADASAF